ncbi:hypothetical protein B5C34_15480 [Pacificimonas flava]|uniref:Agmatinase n=2 Tax=Pacificimonas TaxID=1960290 RepID=A0A219B0N9_9SPHN|nr:MULTISPECIES: agmatinase family protein [Pacificimonas]OWV31897.1 hypothetical protein B5C34_15480 [Pacificimonas flava]
MRLTCRAAVAACFALAFVSGPARAAEPSPKLAEVLGTLSPDQRAFIEDDRNLQRFGLTDERLYILFQNRDAEAVSAAVDAMMRTLASAPYQPLEEPQPDGQSLLDPVGDMPAVPLNTQAPGFNYSSVLRPPVLDDIQREPGPFSLKRYMFETGGIPTFGGAPVAIRKEDLVAGEVDVAFVGVPFGNSSGWRDSRNAPEQLRAMHGIAGFDIESGLDPMVQLSVADYGDLSVDRMATELSIDHVRDMIAEMASVDVVPFIVGGDGAVMFPSVAAMADRYGADELTVVQFDAHYDGETGLPHTISDVQAVSRLLEQDLLKGENLVQIGVRGTDIDEYSLGWVRSRGIRFHPMHEIEAKGWASVRSSALAEVASGPGNVFISFDMSVLDPAYGQAAGRPVSMGLTMREVAPMIRELCEVHNVVGLELLDVAPYLDISYASELNANQILRACLVGLAARDKRATS